MEQQYLPTDKVQHWAAFLQAHNLVEITSILLDSAASWGYIGGQILWMLSPFFGGSTLKQLAELFENPEAVQELRNYLIG